MQTLVKARKALATKGRLLLTNVGEKEWCLDHNFSDQKFSQHTKVQNYKKEQHRHQLQTVASTIMSNKDLMGKLLNSLLAVAQLTHSVQHTAKNKSTAFKVCT